ncbi:MAG: hypothetical protein EXS59_02135 [Candidatus Taylorbacteria bacterium]|nr:hypothetical protein [Candidatus Taylorbacteria bacterium]
MSKLLDAFRQDGLAKKERERNAEEQLRLNQAVAKQKAKAEKLAGERQSLRKFFTAETWKKLEGLGGVFKDETAEYQVGDDTFFVSLDRSDGNPNGRKMLCIKNSTNAFGQAVEIDPDGYATDGAIGTALLYLYRVNAEVN